MNDSTRRRVWLSGYWLANLAFVAVVVMVTQQDPPHNNLPGKVLIAAVSYGWLLPLPTVAAAWLALGRQAWWRRPLIALGLILSLEYWSWPLRDERLTPPYYGDISLFLWLPFAAAAVVWIGMALLGRWRTVLVDNPREELPPAQFALWEMFVWTVLVALMIWPGQNFAATYARDKSSFLDGLLVAVAAFLGGLIAPPLTLLCACVLRIALCEGRPSLVIRVTLAVVILGFAIWGLYFYQYESNQSVDSVLVPLGLALGVMAHACLLGSFLRRLGYRIESRSWWSARQAESATPST